MLLDYVVEFWGNNWNLCLYTQTTATTEFRKHQSHDWTTEYLHLQNTYRLQTKPFWNTNRGYGIYLKVPKR